MTATPSLVSSQYLASSLLLPVTQAQAALTTAMTEESTGQYADLGLQLGDQSGYELSLKEHVQQLQALTAGNSLVSTSLSTAQNALTAISSSAQATINDLVAWTPGRQFGRFTAEHGSIGSAGSDRLDQRDLGRPVRVRRDQFL